MIINNVYLTHINLLQNCSTISQENHIYKFYRFRLKIKLNQMKTNPRNSYEYSWWEIGSNTIRNIMLYRSFYKNHESVHLICTDPFYESDPRLFCIHVYILIYKYFLLKDECYYSLADLALPDPTQLCFTTTFWSKQNWVTFCPQSHAFNLIVPATLVN